MGWRFGEAEEKGDAEGVAVPGVGVRDKVTEGSGVNVGEAVKDGEGEAVGEAYHALYAPYAEAVTIKATRTTANAIVVFFKIFTSKEKCSQ